GARRMGFSAAEPSRTPRSDRRPSALSTLVGGQITAPLARRSTPAARRKLRVLPHREQQRGTYAERDGGGDQDCIVAAGPVVYEAKERWGDARGETEYRVLR